MKTSVVGWRKIRLMGLLFSIRPTILVHLFKVLTGFKRSVIQTVHGVFWVDLLSHFGRVIVTEGTFEPETCKILHQYLTKGDIFIDIGANEGYFSVVGAQIVGGTGKIISVEPQNRLIHVIQKNVHLNNLHNIEVLNLAISDQDKTNAIIWLSPNTFPGSTSIVQKYFVARKQNTYCRSLDSLFNELNIEKVKLVKIDVEGFEPEVIRSAQSLLKTHRIMYVLIDFHSSILNQRGLNPEDTHQFIISCGYTCDKHNQKKQGYYLYASPSANSRGMM